MSRCTVVAETTWMVSAPGRRRWAQPPSRVWSTPAARSTGGSRGAEPARRLVLPLDGAIVTALREGSAAPAAEARSIAAALLAAPAPEPAAAA